VAVCIDYGVFHLWLAPKLRERGIKVLYFIPPQIWASRQGRLKKLRRAADEVLVVLPFEEEFYRSHGIAATFVGNPVAARLPAAVSKSQWLHDHHMNAQRVLCGLFPGSRRMEINHLMREQVGAARILDQRFPGRFQFAMSKAKSLKPDYFNAALERAGGDGWITVVEESHALLSASDVALVKSGTTTLEATLYRTPIVVMYRGAWWASIIARRMMTVKHISLPNNLAGKEIVPELLQYDANPQRIAEEALKLLEPERNATIKAELDAVARQFDKIDTPRRVAERVERLARGG
jgi:lipid-A-disaccharide synthase